MNRCQASASHASLFQTSRRKLLQWTWTAPLLGLAVAASAQTMARPFPPNVERGTLVVVVPPVIQLDGKTDSLSPGARIRGVNNMLVMSGSIIGKSLVVNYLRNPTGQVHEVWVLTDAEAAQPLPAKQ